MLIPGKLEAIHLNREVTLLLRTPHAAGALLPLESQLRRKVPLNQNHELSLP